MTVAHIRPADVETFSFEWGTMKWFVSPVTIPGAANSQGEVIVNPGQGHAGTPRTRSWAGPGRAPDLPDEEIPTATLGTSSPKPGTCPGGLRSRRFLR